MSKTRFRYHQKTMPNGTVVKSIGPVATTATTATTTPAKVQRFDQSVTTIQVALKQGYLAQRQMDQCLVTIAQHIVIQNLTVEEVGHLLFNSPWFQGSVEESFKVAKRLRRLSRNEEALHDLKYGLQPIAKAISVTKRAI